MSMRREHARRRPTERPWTATTTCSASSRRDAALERSDFLVQSTRAAAQVPRPPQGAHRGARRPDAHRRGARLPLDRAGPHVPQPQPLPTTRPPASGSARPRSSRRASELVELYNPADIYAAFAEAAREAAGMRAEPTGRGRPHRRRRHLAGRDRRAVGEDPYAAAADSWAAGQPRAARRGRRRGRRAPPVRPRARVPGAQPAHRGAPARAVRGRRGGPQRHRRRADHRRRRRRAPDPDRRPALPRPRSSPRTPRASGGRSTSADELVEFYDPTDVFGDLADSLAEAYPSVAPELAAAADGEAADEARRRAGRRRQADDGRRSRCRGRRRRRRGGGRADRVSMRLAAAELVESREILPGQWLQAYHAPDLATRLAGRPVRPRPDRRLLRDRPAPAVLAQHDRRRRPASITIHFRIIGRGTEWFTHLRPGDTRRHARPARPAVRGRPAQPPPPARRRRPRHGRRPDARRRGDPRRPPGDAAVRRRQRARGLPVEPAARRGRVRRRHRRRLARPPRLRDRARARLRGAGPTRPSPAARRRCSPRWPGSRPSRRRAARRRQARPEARRRQGRPDRLAGGAAQGVPPGLDGAEHGLRGRGLPRLRRHGVTGTPQRVCREGPVFASDELDWEAAGPEGQAPGRDRRAVGERADGRRPSAAEAATVRRVGRPRDRDPGRAAPPRRAARRPRHESTCPSTSGAGSSCRTRSSSRRGRSATASSTATSSTSTASAPSAARARRSGRGSATRRRA